MVAFSLVMHNKDLAQCMSSLLDKEKTTLLQLCLTCDWLYFLVAPLAYKSITLQEPRHFELLQNRLEAMSNFGYLCPSTGNIANSRKGPEHHLLRLRYALARTQILKLYLDDTARRGSNQSPRRDVEASDAQDGGSTELAKRVQSLFNVLLQLGDDDSLDLKNASVPSTKPRSLLPFAEIHTVILDSLNNLPEEIGSSSAPSLFLKTKTLKIRFTANQELHEVWKRNMRRLSQLFPSVNDLHLLLKDGSILQTRYIESMTYLPGFLYLNTVHIYLDGKFGFMNAPATPYRRANNAMVAGIDISEFARNFLERMPNLRIALQEGPTVEEEDDDVCMVDEQNHSAFEELKVHFYRDLSWKDKVYSILGTTHDDQIEQYGRVVMNVTAEFDCED